MCDHFPAENDCPHFVGRASLSSLAEIFPFETAKPAHKPVEILIVDRVVIGVVATHNAIVFLRRENLVHHLEEDVVLLVYMIPDNRNVVFGMTHKVLTL